jgi:hypothetical protein
VIAVVGSAVATVFVRPAAINTDDLAAEYVPAIAVAETVIVFVTETVDEKFVAETAS